MITRLSGLLFIAVVCSSVAGVSQAISGTYVIKNVSTGMLLRPMDANKKNETPIVGYSPTNWKCMSWDFNQVNENTYYLRNLFTNKTLQPQKDTITDGTLLEQQPLDMHSNDQQWEFLPVGNNAFLIRLKGTELYITPAEKEAVVNSRIILSKKKSGQIQHWSIYEQHPDF